MHTHTHTHTTLTNACMHACMHAHTHTHACMHARTHICCSCIIGKDYPKPIVDHAVASKECMARMGVAYKATNKWVGGSRQVLCAARLAVHPASSCMQEHTRGIVGGGRNQAAPHALTLCSLQHLTAELLCAQNRQHNHRMMHTPTLTHLHLHTLTYSRVHVWPDEPRGESSAKEEGASAGGAGPSSSGGGKKKAAPAAGGGKRQKTLLEAGMKKKKKAAKEEEEEEEEDSDE